MTVSTMVQKQMVSHVAETIKNQILMQRDKFASSFEVPEAWQKSSWKGKNRQLTAKSNDVSYEISMEGLSFLAMRTCNVQI